MVTEARKRQIQRNVLVALACLVGVKVFPVVLRFACEAFWGPIVDESHVCPSALLWLGDSPSASVLVVACIVLGTLFSGIGLFARRLSLACFGFACLGLGLMSGMFRVMRGNYPIYEFFIISGSALLIAGLAIHSIRKRRKE